MSEQDWTVNVTILEEAPFLVNRNLRRRSHSGQGLTQEWEKGEQRDRSLDVHVIEQ